MPMHGSLTGSTLAPLPLPHSARPPNRKKVNVVKILPPRPVGPPWRHLAVDPVPPAGWGTRSTRSHLGKLPEHEIPDL
jgi:hypothetical protein